jgi:hypothetical protein
VASGYRLIGRFDSMADTVAKFSKQEREQLRRLASAAYERELGNELAILDKSFSEWRNGKLLSSELSDRIHDFHQNAAREVWSTYQVRDDSMLVSRAIARGIISKTDLPGALREKLQDQIAAFIAHHGS